MPGLVVGVLIRHLDTVTTELDEWLAHPAVWELESSRRAHEGTLHIQGRDPEDTPRRDRRTWTLIDVAGAITFAASANDDQGRLGELRAVGDRLVRTARSTSNLPRCRPCRNLVRTWRLPGISRRIHPPAGRRTPPRFRLLSRPAPSRRAAQTWMRLPADDLEWAAAMVVAAALHPPVGQWSFDGSLFASGPDRTAASAVPHLLLPAFTETPPEAETAPLLDEEDLAVVADAVTALTTSLHTEVRRITARALSVIWTAPCGPGQANSATCRHVIAWSAVEASARHVGSPRGHSPASANTNSFPAHSYRPCETRLPATSCSPASVPP